MTSYNQTNTIPLVENSDYGSGLEGRGDAGECYAQDHVPELNESNVFHFVAHTYTKALMSIECKFVALFYLERLMLVGITNRFSLYYCDITLFLRNAIPLRLALSHSSEGTGDLW